MTTTIDQARQRRCASCRTPCRISRRSRSGSGSAPARATRRTARTASRISSSTWPSRARSGAARRQIAEEIEEVGGELNAATGLETTAYFARVLKGDEGVALGLIADILLNSAFRTAELEGEREVILQEIAATRDSPEDIGYELLHEAAFPRQPVGRAILGTPTQRQAASRPAISRSS